MKNMKKYRLGEVLDVTRGASLSGQFYATEGKFVRLTAGNFDYRNNSFKENKSKDNLFYTGKFKPEFLMKKGDIITPLTEQAIGLLGSTAIIPESGKYIQSQDIAKIICNEKLLDKGFAYYLISSNLVKQQLSAAAQQTKIRHTSPDKIKSCIAYLPPLATQRRVAEVLGNLDRKIALNREMNETLEKMAKQLYDYWFVQFDFPDKNGRPYKASGGKMIWNEQLKRDLPEGWEVKSLNKWMDVKSGFAFNSDYYLAQGKYKIITIKNVQDHLLDTSKCDYVDEIPVGMKKWCDLSLGDRLISLTGNCGRLCIVSEENLLLNQRVGLIDCDNKCKEFSYWMLSSFEFQAICGNLANGAAQANLSPIDLCKTVYFIPPDKIIQQFNTIISSITNHLISNQQQIASLTSLRDELLPLLMNGQVECAEKKVRRAK